MKLVAATSFQFVSGAVDIQAATPYQILEMISTWRGSSQCKYITLVNPHSIMMAARDQEFASALRGSALALPDGVGVSIASRLLSGRPVKRVPGPSLLLELCDLGRLCHLRHFFLGTTDETLRALSHRLSTTYPGLLISGSFAPPFRPMAVEEDEELIKLIDSTRPDVVWIGLGTGKQEKWMAAHVGRISAAALIGVGAAFDFHAGTIPWAPAWVRRLGLEWAYRLFHEPRRLLRRNLDGPVFMAHVLRQFFKLP